jgi:hypothetical protein
VPATTHRFPRQSRDLERNLYHVVAVAEDEVNLDYRKALEGFCLTSFEARLFTISNGSLRFDQLDTSCMWGNLRPSFPCGPFDTVFHSRLEGEGCCTPCFCRCSLNFILSGEMQCGVGLMRRAKDPVARIPDILKSRREHESAPLGMTHLILK